MSAQIQQLTSSTQGSSAIPLFPALRKSRKGHLRTSCFVAEDAGDAGDAGDGGALMEANGAGDEGRVATLLHGEVVGDGGDGTVLMEEEGAGGQGGVSVSLEALVNEAPDFDWPDHSWMPYLFEHPFGHYHKGFTEATVDEAIPIERNDRLSLLRRRFFYEQRGCEDLIFLAPDGGHFDVERRTL
ncbi:hypothetical protein PsorP6_004710 [Peronosclerospora sorghi]|uniref:Uncharacterized protein n=1 Tax=Peronosclerospora sorghi TaxID=230839 RepID=A0ACC0VPC1_9STRA|nr:hypothetical protein PsorP6_004710 [Peronosclerospora sorghi]